MPIVQVMLLASVIFLAAGVGQSAEERLFLKGKITSIDRVSKQVVVDVFTLGCQGPKTFGLNNLAKYNIAVGNVIKFYVDSSYCPGPEGHRIVDLWRVKR